MKIRKIKWKNHPVLGDLALDFTNPQTGHTYNTIVLAGENGTGKSTIFEAISIFLNHGSYAHFEYIEYDVNGDIYKTLTPVDEATLAQFFDIADDSGDIHKIRYDKNIRSNLLNTEPRDLRSYGCVYSKARSDYKTRKITSTTTSELDKIKYDVDVEEDFTSLKQLIVDVVNQDYAGYSEGNKALGANPKSWDQFYLTSKLYRFKNAFDNFFDKIKYEKIDDIEGEKTILFSKNGRYIAIDKLSTGEKQIVFRGVFLLRNTSVLNGATIMIDEPELSMHPKWERKILSYYKRLFVMNGQQTAQIIFATHSDHVLREALADQVDSVVVTLDDNNGIISCRNINAPSVLPSITIAETTYNAFDVVSNDYHIELFGWLQDKQSLTKVKDCDSYIKSHSSYDPAKHYKPSSHGSTTYDTLCTYIRNAIHHPDSGNIFTETELRISIELLIRICT